MTDKQTIYFLIVNYNGSKDTIKLLKSIDSLVCNNYFLHAVIIDNDSEVADVNAIESFIADNTNVTLIKSNTNDGYFPAFNVGLDFIRPHIPATVLLCNNDLIFEKDFLKLYLENTYNEDVFVVAPNVITSNGVHQNPHVTKKISNARKLLYEIYFSHYFIATILKKISGMISGFRKNLKEGNSKKSQYIYMGIGACYILRPVFFKHIQKLDDRVFLGGEEALLAGQLEKAGGKTFYDSSLIVHHAEGVSFSKMSSRWRYEASKKSYMVYKEYL